MRVRFRNGQVFVGDFSLPFSELTKKAVLARVSLSATGFYRTPDITWDRAAATGNPFYYFAYGACCTEVEIDRLTGENRVRRVDILHDVGRSLNPALDIGQIEGGFVQGLGWLTTEELVYDRDGRLRTHAPLDLQDPGRLRRAGRLPRRALGWGERAGHDLRLESRGRAARHAGDRGLLRPR